MNKKMITVYTVMILLMIMPQALAASYSVNMELDTNYIKMGQGISTMIYATITNTGELSDTYTITPEKWMTNPSKVTLAPGESKTIGLLISPPCDIEAKEYTLGITTKSDNSKDTETITIDVLKVYRVELGQITAKTSCVGDKETFVLDISNNGKNTETFAITATSGILEKDKLTLNSGETQQVNLELPVTEGQKSVDVTVKSLLSTSCAQDSKTIKLVGVSCYSQDIMITPESKTMCIKDTSDFTLTVKNTGTKKDTYTMTTDFGELSSDALTIEPSEEKKIKLTVSPEDMGTYKANIDVRSRSGTKKVTVAINAQNCKGIAVITIPKEKTVCKGATAEYTVTIKNIGKTEDTLDISTTMGELTEKKMTIEAGQTKELTLKIPTENLEDEKYKVTVTAESDIKDSSESVLNVENCYSSALSMDPQITKVCPGTDAVFTITAQNTGKNKDTYTIETSSGELEESTIELESLQAKNIKLTVPAVKESKNVVINMFSPNSQNTKTVNITLKDTEICFGFIVSANPEIIEAEDYKGYLYTLTVKNTGEYSSEFSVSAVGGPDWIFIDPKKLNIDTGEEDQFYIYVSPPYGTEAGTYNINIEVKRDGESKKITTLKLMLGRTGTKTESQQPNKTETEKEVPKTHPVNVDTETTYEIRENYTEKVVGTYKKDNKDIEFVMNFRTGSFIIEIGDARIEDEQPELGENTYEITTQDKQYTVTIDFTEVNTTTDTYRFKIINAEVTELEKETSTPTGKATEDKAPVSKNLIYATIIGLIIIILILFGPEIAEKTKDFFTEEVEEKKEKEEKKEDAKPVIPAGDGIPLEEISGIGGKKAEALRKAGIMNVNDLANSNISDVMAEAVTSEKQAKDLIRKAKALLKKKSKKEEPKAEKKKDMPKKKESVRKDVKEDIKDILESI
ncbi:MAG: helix-hairpin-helix domain-containing protein [archaeon]